MPTTINPSGQTITQFDVQTGAATNLLNSVGPGTTGQVLQSAGNAANPAYSTATYPLTTTAQQILYSTANNVVGQLTTANSTLPATNAAGTLAMRALTVNRQVFTSTGTYTPTTGMLYCDVEVIGGGGGGGGAAATSTTTVAAAGGGGGGGYARGVFSSATIGASQAVTIGAAGTAGSAGANTGGTGGTTSVGALISATGGIGGNGATASSSASFQAGGNGGAGTGGDFQTHGSWAEFGEGAISVGIFSFVKGGGGGNTFFGGGGPTTNTSTGNAATSYGGGGSGAANLNTSASASAGGVGFKGLVVVTEYVIN